MKKNKNRMGRVSANVDVVVGALQEAVGSAIGSKKMVANGAARQFVAHARDEVTRLAAKRDAEEAQRDKAAQARDEAIRATHRAERDNANLEIVEGAVQQAVGHATGNLKMEADGAAHQVLGHARDEAAKAQEAARAAPVKST